MKKLITLLAVVLITAVSWAQSPQKMSYQAVIRNASNTLVTNTAIGMQISILQGTATGTAVYVETQTPTTNANGLVSIEIGGGTVVSGTFSAIDWSAGPYFIKTETDPAGGTTYTITGTSQLLSVPYALSAGNVTGLEKITEGGHTGWRLIGRDPANYGDIGVTAIDLSFSFNPSTSHGATGNNSVAMGYITNASGDYATAMGRSTNARAYASTAIGAYNVGAGNATTWVATEALFEIGNGTGNTTRSNAFLVLKNGTLLAPSFDLAEITSTKALITKEYADTNLTPSGLEKITEGGNTGWRLIGQNPANYGNIGLNAIDLSYSNSASTTRGATGIESIALGYLSTASDQASTAMGFETTASGLASTALGRNTTASGDHSTAMGYDTKAPSYAETAIGSYNTNYTIATGGNVQFNAVDRLFTIGNGLSNTTRSNAFTVYKNGNTDVNGVFRAQNNAWPTTGAGVEIAYDSSQGFGYVQSYDRGTSTWKELVLGALDVVPVIDNFTFLGTSAKRWLKIYAVNGTIQTSDRRLKKDIKKIAYGLNTVMKLRPVSYKWKKGNQDLNLGLIAQEVQKLLPEVVDVGTDKAKTLGLKYTELIPILIKATQEQQKEITELKSLVKKLLKQRMLVSK